MTRRSSRQTRRSAAGTSPSKSRTLRCAIYTRVSSDNGLEQDFNSLDAQREAGVAYIRSQAHEGWVLASGHFDDGGYSGGSLDRPALTMLLEAVEQRQIDVIVVYKVDRLTRSLADFAKLVEIFDAHGVSFISITQSFNTTTSMGRLTLNMLLSFAQFEREVTGERIRDKIAASKKKGIWVGGVVPLGYRVVERKLLVDEEEAKTVRLIFDRYLELQSIGRLLQELRERGIATRRRTLATGRPIGGIVFTKGPLAYLLRNRMYVGELNHGANSYPAEHQAIVAREAFDAVQALLTSQAAATGYCQSKSEALLQGKLFDDKGHRMTPSFAVKRGVRYRYYVSRATTEGRQAEAGSVTRVPADDVERAVIDAIAAIPEAKDRVGARGERNHADAAIARHGNGSRVNGCGEGSSVGHSDVGGSGGEGRDGSAARTSAARLVDECVERIAVRPDGLVIALTPASAIRAASNMIHTPWIKPPFRVQREIIAPAESQSEDPRAMSGDTRSKLLLAIAKARRWLDDLTCGRVSDIDALAAREGRSARSASMLLSLAFLAPELVKAIVDNRMPRGIGLTQMMDLPGEWDEQWGAQGLSAARTTV